ncbi:MAG TPA: diguanylate cyclase, partial [Thiobacillus sp.]|nr:diguanylate cyclase [Thiobacillus sp.]
MASIGKEAVATTMTMPRTIAGGQVQALGEAFGGNEPTGAKLKEREIAAIHAQYRQASQELASLPEVARQPQSERYQAVMRRINELGPMLEKIKATPDDQFLRQYQNTLLDTQSLAGKDIAADGLTEDVGEFDAADAIAKTGAATFEAGQKEHARLAPRPDGVVAQFGADLTQAMLMMLPSIAAGAATKSPGVALATMFPEVYGVNYGEARKKGLLPDQAALESMASSASEILTEQTPISILLKPGTGMLKRVLGAMWTEGVQEGLQSGVEQLIDAGLLRSDSTMAETWSVMQNPETWKKMGYSALLGAGMGAGFGVLTHGAEALTAGKQDAAPEPSVEQPSAQPTASSATQPPVVPTAPAPVAPTQSPLESAANEAHQATQAQAAASDGGWEPIANLPEVGAPTQPAVEPLHVEQSAPPVATPASPASEKPVPDLLHVLAQVGLDRAHWESQGIDKAVFNDTRRTGGFGKPLFRKKGGMTLDQTAEFLMQRGFLPEGQYDANDALALVDRALRGEKIYSTYDAGAAFDQQAAAHEETLAIQAAEFESADKAPRLADEADIEATASGMPEYDEPAGLRFDREEYHPDMDGEARSLFELHQMAKDVDEDAADAVLERTGDSIESQWDAARRLHDIIRSGHGQEAAGSRQAHGEEEQGAPSEAPPAGQRSAEPRAQAVAPSQTADLFGGKSATAQAVKDAEVERQRKMDAAPPMESGAGDLFSGKSKQTDIEDAPARQERRSDAATRKRVAEMSPDEMRAALLTDAKTGLYNDRAYAEHAKLPIQVAIDLDSLKWVNDNLGHESGDAMLKAMGTAIDTYAIWGYRLGGDEFVVQAKNEIEAKNIMENVSAVLARAEITVQMPDGSTVTKKGVAFSYGYGKTLKEADDALSLNKAAREESGKRSGRGIEPPGVVKNPAVGKRADVDQAADDGQDTDQAVDGFNRYDEVADIQRVIGNLDDELYSYYTPAEVAKIHREAPKSLEAQPEYLREKLKEAIEAKKLRETSTPPPRDDNETPATSVDIRTGAITVKNGDTKTVHMGNAERVDAAAHEAATSPQNDLPQPTEAQKDAGNYQKGHVTVGGLDIAIENPAGSKRRPEWPELKSHYGYFKRTEGKDGDQVDVFVKPGTPEDYSGPVFVVDQTNKDGDFDEHKIMLGFDSSEAARAGYLGNYTKGWNGLGAMRKFSLGEFKAWLESGDTKKPVMLDKTVAKMDWAKKSEPSAP